MLEKKGRLFLMLFSIMLSCALMIICLGLVDTVMNSIKEPMEKVYDGKDIIISSKTDEVFISEDDIDKENIKNLVGEIDITSVVEDDDEMIYASLKGMKSFNQKCIDGEFKDENASNCIISKRIADERNLKVGDKIDIRIQGEKKSLKVSGITITDGVFL